MHKLIQGKKASKQVTSVLLYLGILLAISTCILVVLKLLASVVFITLYASLALIFSAIHLKRRGQLTLELRNEILCVTNENTTIIKCNINDVSEIEMIGGKITLIVLYFKARDSFSFSARDLDETQIIEFQSWIKGRLS